MSLIIFPLLILAIIGFGAYLVSDRKKRSNILKLNLAFIGLLIAIGVYVVVKLW